MPQYKYRGRDKNGSLRRGERAATSADALNLDLVNEGIFPIKITLYNKAPSFLEKLKNASESRSLLLEELAIFARQLQLLHQAGVQMTTALKQLAAHTRSRKLSHAIAGIIEYIEKGESLSTAMNYYPDVFSRLITNIVKIGENSGRLSESLEHLHQYLDFEASNIKHIKAAFRYPIFVFAAIFVAILIINIFVIPTFARFYTSMQVSLPWETNLLIGTSNFLIHDGIYLLAAIILGLFFFFRYIKTPQGRLKWHKFILNIPIIGPLLKRVILIRFCQSLSIMLNSGISVPLSLALLKDIVINSYILQQISVMQECIERGMPVTQSIVNVNLFSSLEIQILAVGEKNGELSPALNFIGSFHSREIDYDLKRMTDVIGPLLITIISVLVLIIALGVYLPIWNMVNLVHS